MTDEGCDDVLDADDEDRVRDAYVYLRRIKEAYNETADNCPELLELLETLFRQDDPRAVMVLLRTFNDEVQEQLVTLSVVVAHTAFVMIKTALPGDESDD